MVAVDSSLEEGVELIHRNFVVVDTAAVVVDIEAVY